MNCPYCDSPETKVVDSREAKDGRTIKRRRECLNCEKRFTTIEKILKLDLEVIKSSGEIQEFSLGKIRKSLHKACEKRPVTLEEIETILTSISDDLKKVVQTPIATTEVGNIVLKHLKEFDEMAFLKYAIVHNNYNNMNEFVKELTKLKKFGDLKYKKK